MFRKNKSIIGLDLGGQVVKAVEITLDGSEPVITGFARSEITPGGDRAEAITQVFQNGHFKNKNVVTSVSGQSVVVRYITMVKMSDSELRQAIRFESDKYLPFDADEVVLDCQPLRREPPNASDDGSNGEQMSVVLAACRTSAVQEQVNEINRHGLNPMAVDVDVFALANAWELCGLDDAELEEEERAIALVDIEAETIKREAEGREAEVGRAITPVLEDLVSEISLSLDYVENREGLRVDEVLLSGGGSMAPGAVSFIEQAIGRTARTWNPLEGLRVAADRVDVEELEACAPSLAVAIGLASRVRAA